MMLMRLFLCSADRGTTWPVRTASLLALLAPGCLSSSPAEVDETDGAESGDAADDSDGGEESPSGDGAEPGDDDEGSGGEGTTIYDVRKGEVPLGTVVTLGEVVVTTPVVLDDTGNAKFLVGEPEGGEFSGIYVYVYADAFGSELAPGDIVTITGTYDEFYESSQITISAAEDLEVVGSGPLPEPALVDPTDIQTGGPLAENYESVLVQVREVTVTNPDLGYGDFEVAGGLVVDDFFMPPLQPSADSTFESLTGVMLYSFDQFRLAPRDMDDVVGGDFGANPATVYEIQGGDLSPNARVIVEDVVVTSPLNFSGTTFFVQESDGGPLSGIAVYVPEPEGLEVAVGDVLTIEGTYTEFYDQSQLKVDSVDAISRNGSTDPLEPEVVTASEVATGGAAQEDYEGVLVRVAEVSVVEEADEFGVWTVSGDLKLDRLFFEMDDWPAPSMGTAYSSLTGVMTYSFEEAKLAPRTSADLVE